MTTTAEEGSNCSCPSGTGAKHQGYAYRHGQTAITGTYLPPGQPRESHPLVAYDTGLKISTDDLKFQISLLLQEHSTFSQYHLSSSDSTVKLLSRISIFSTSCTTTRSTQHLTMPRGPYDTTGVIKPNAPKPPRK